MENRFQYKIIRWAFSIVAVLMVAMVTLSQFASYISRDTYILYQIVLATFTFPAFVLGLKVITENKIHWRDYIQYEWGETRAHVFNWRSLKDFFASTVFFYLFAFLILLSVLLPGDFTLLYSQGADATAWREGVRIELTGFLFDILLFGVLFSLYDRMRTKGMEIRRYKEEIDDFRYWKNEEASYRIAGNIRRLDSLGASRELDLANCYLQNTNIYNRKVPFIRDDGVGVDLSRSQLKHAILMNAKLQYTILNGASLHNADLRNANLSCAQLRGSQMHGANLSGADLTEADLRDADLYNVDLTSANLTGADMRKVKKVTIEQLCNSSALADAKFDPEVAERLQEQCPAKLTIEVYPGFEPHKHTPTPPKRERGEVSISNEAQIHIRLFDSNIDMCEYLIGVPLEHERTTLFLLRFFIVNNSPQTIDNPEILFRFPRSICIDGGLSVYKQGSNGRKIDCHIENKTECVVRTTLSIDKLYPQQIVYMGIECRVPFPSVMNLDVPKPGTDDIARLAKLKVTETLTLHASVVSNDHTCAKETYSLKFVDTSDQDLLEALSQQNIRITKRARKNHSTLNNFVYQLCYGEKRPLAVAITTRDNIERDLKLPINKVMFINFATGFYFKEAGYIYVPGVQQTMASPENKNVTVQFVDDDEVVLLEPDNIEK